MYDANTCSNELRLWISVGGIDLNFEWRMDENSCFHFYDEEEMYF